MQAFWVGRLRGDPASGGAGRYKIALRPKLRTYLQAFWGRREAGDPASGGRGGRRMDLVRNFGTCLQPFWGGRGGGDPASGGGAEIEDITSFQRCLRCSGFIISVSSCPFLRFNQYLVSAVSAFQRSHHFCIAVVHFSVSTSFLFSGFCVAAVS